MSTPCAHRTVLAMAAACIVWAFLAFPARSGAEIPAGSEWVEPATGMVFVRVPAGCFTLGCEGRGCPDSALPAQEVCLDGFWIAGHETTQAQWEQVMGGNPASFRGGRRPVENVSWRGAMEFARRLTELSPAGGSFSLPRGAQWEYACSAGWSGREPGDFARLEATVPVDRLEPNAYGVCGMAGNVREWVRDPFKGAEAGEEAARTVRGDSWMKAPKNPRCTLRLGLSPGVVSNTVGFRLVRVDPPEDQPRKPDPRPAVDAEGRTPPLVLRSIGLEERGADVAVLLEASRPVSQSSVFFLGDPPRLVADLPGRWEIEAPREVELDSGRLLRARVGRHEDKLRIVFDLAPGGAVEPETSTSSRGLALLFTRRELGLAEVAEEAPGVLREVRFDASVDGLNMVLLADRPVSGFESYASGSGDRLTVVLPGRWRSEVESHKLDPAAPVRKVAIRVERQGLVVEVELSEPLRAQPVLIAARRGLVVSLPSEAFGEPRGRPMDEPGPAPTNVLQGVRIGRQGGDARVELETEQPVADFDLRAGPDPPSVVLEAPGLWKSLVPGDRKLDSGPVRKVSVSVEDGRLEVLLRLASPVAGPPKAEPVAGGLSLRLPMAASGPEASPAPTPASTPAPSPGPGPGPGADSAGLPAERDLPVIQGPSRFVAETFEGLRMQLYFSCSMASASWQTLVWDRNEARPSDLAEALAPYKAMFKSMALEKGSDERTWRLINSPVFDECAKMFSQGAAPGACEGIKDFDETKLAQVYAAAAVSDDPRATVRSMIRRFLEKSD